MKMGIEDIRKILENVPESQRKQIEKIVSGRVVKHVICGDCGRVIAEIYEDNSIEPTIDGRGEMWLFAYRYRLDGYLGFQCRCGNDSRLSSQEIGNRGIEKNKVTKKDIQSVMLKIQEKPSEYKEVNGELKIDNFIIKVL